LLLRENALNLLLSLSLPNTFKPVSYLEEDGSLCLHQLPGLVHNAGVKRAFLSLS
jgi:hypothetical protein